MSLGRVGGSPSLPAMACKQGGQTCSCSTLLWMVVPIVASMVEPMVLLMLVLMVVLVFVMMVGLTLLRPSTLLLTHDEQP